MRILYQFRLIYILLTIGLYSCQIDKEPSFQEIPIYPNAQLISSEDRNTGSAQSIRLLTLGRTEDVQTFYETELSKRGWQFEGQSGFHFGYFYPNHNGSSNYKLVLRMSFGLTEKQETIILIDQIIAYQGQNIGLNP
jgi:hypothetical protein